MGSTGFSLQEATLADVDDMARITIAAMSWDPVIQTFNQELTPAETQAVSRGMIEGKMTVGVKLGACKAWKVVDDNGKIVAWGGLGFPIELTPEQKSAMQGRMAFPPHTPESLLKFNVFFEGIFRQCLAKNGYDPTKHFMRQSTMVDPDYQRMGLGKLITKKCNEVADAAGRATFARTRPTSVKLFEKEGYRTLEVIEVPYHEFGLEGSSKVFAMKRDVGGLRVGFRGELKQDEMVSEASPH